MPVSIAPTSFDHVALWVDDRDALADFVCAHLGMHVIDRTDAFTLVGVDARRGKLTLFDAEGPRESGVLRRVVLRVRDVEQAVSELPAELTVERHDGVASFDAPAGLRMGLTQSEESPDYDLDHVVLGVPDPDSAAARLEQLGFERADGRLAVADKHVRLERANEQEGERPLLNHLALLVDSAEEAQDAAREREAEIADFVDAANTRAVFVWGPDRIKLEYVEHKPGFALV